MWPHAVDPWNLEFFEEAAFLATNTAEAQKRLRKKLTGWPYETLQPARSPVRIGVADGLALGLLPGWWLYALLTHVPAPQRDQVGLLLFLPLFVLVAGRLGLYLTNCQSPLSLMGRLLTFRWIIPRFDYVFIAPLCAISTAAAGTRLVFAFKADPLSVWPATLSGALLCLFLIGPTLDRWKLTGHYRHSPPRKNTLRGQLLQQELTEL